MKYCSVCLSIILSLIAFGCTTAPKRNFTGVPSYTSSYSIVLTSPSSISDKVYISEIDGQKTSSIWSPEMPTVVDVTPGDHTFKVFAKAKSAFESYSGILSFRTIKDTTYKVTLEPIKNEPLLIKNIGTFNINEDISPPLILGDHQFNNVSGLLLHWGLLKTDDNLCEVLESESQSTKLLSSLRQHLATVPYSQTTQILDVTNKIVDKAKKESNARKLSYFKCNFVVRDISNNSLMASIAATYHFELHRMHYNAIPPFNIPKIYTPPPTFNMPKIDIPPPPPTFNMPKID